MFRLSKIASKICRLIRLANNSAGRTSAEILLPDGMNLNQELVKQGWCCWYRKYAPADTVLEGLEWEAREAKKGLWFTPTQGPPWDWRKRVLPKGKS
jgi:endonuclease YncB( thermonuclease family)